MSAFDVRHLHCVLRHEKILRVHLMMVGVKRLILLVCVRLFVHLH
jgi:hypothetical protein